MARPEPRTQTESPSVATGEPLVALVYLVAFLIATVAPVWMAARARGSWEEFEVEVDEI